VVKTFCLYKITQNRKALYSTSSMIGANGKDKLWMDSFLRCTYNTSIPMYLITKSWIRSSSL
jgi:hypothetical protein